LKEGTHDPRGYREGLLSQRLDLGKVEYPGLHACRSVAYRCRTQGLRVRRASRARLQFHLTRRPLRRASGLASTSHVGDHWVWWLRDAVTFLLATVEYPAELALLNLMGISPNLEITVAVRQ